MAPQQVRVRLLGGFDVRVDGVAVRRAEAHLHCVLAWLAGEWDTIDRLLDVAEVGLHNVPSVLASHDHLRALLALFRLFLAQLRDRMGDKVGAEAARRAAIAVFERIGEREGLTAVAESMSTR